MSDSRTFFNPAECRRSQKAPLSKPAGKKPFETMSPYDLAGEIGFVKINGKKLMARAEESNRFSSNGSVVARVFHGNAGNLTEEIISLVPRKFLLLPKTMPPDLPKSMAKKARGETV